MLRESVFLHQFSFGFDGAVASLWWPLAFGNCLIVPSERELKDIILLTKLIIKHEVQVLFSTPGWLTLLAEELLKQKSYSLRCVLFGGEALSGMS